MTETILTAFTGHSKLVSGPPADVATALWKRAQSETAEMPLVFDQEGRQVDLDLSGSETAVRTRHAPPADSATRAGAGRPKLGVVAREVTLLPRHWDWLKAQPGGASAALRRLVEEARRQGDGDGRAMCDAAYRFMSAIAGNLAGFEEAARALFAGDLERLRAIVGDWPRDISDHALELAGAARRPH